MKFLLPGNLNAGMQVSIILRHAERDPIVHMGNPVPALLTEQGMSDSIDLGKKLSTVSPVRIFYSPFPRCRQTAQGIMQGIVEAGGSATIEDKHPGLAGPYVTGDWRKIGAMVEEEGQASFIRRWFDGGVSTELLMPLEKAAPAQLKIMADQLSEPGPSFVNVTHDWNIMILLEYFFSLKHDIIGQPGYLDGMCSFAEGPYLHLRYHDHEIKIRRE